ncbi:hypothetical protein Btru_058256 [Bulinus truncatus]|nr:hypothetical protein Btru_058256 [Bulinus truncatus]
MWSLHLVYILLIPHLVADGLPGIKAIRCANLCEGMCTNGSECRPFGCGSKCQPVTVETQPSINPTCATLEQCISDMGNLMRGLFKVFIKSQTETSTKFLETFQVSTSYLGKRYYLRKWTSSNFNMTLAGDTCSRLGGSLAEINDEGEFAFVRNFVKQFNFYVVYLAGSDEKQEGSWVNPLTNTPLKYLKWGEKEPNGGTGENFLALCRNADFFMIDVWSRYGGTILCEVPQKRGFST